MKYLSNIPKKISVNELKPFEDNPYKVIDNDEMRTLTESISENGIMTPLIVRAAENGGYEVLSGHRRLYAARKAGLETVPAFVVSAIRDEAAVMVVDSNLHREHVLISEKAFAYKLKMEALSHQGKRTDLTSSQIATKSDSAAEIGRVANESRDTVYRYIRLTNLIPELLDMMDESKIAFSVGVELSYLDDQSQYDVLDMCEENDCTPSYAQAVRMHKLSRDGKLDKSAVASIMSEEKANQREKVTIPLERLKGKIPASYNDKQMQDYILKACEYYLSYLQRQRENER